MDTIPNRAKILYEEVEKASKDIKEKFVKTRKKARFMRILIILVSSAITILNAYEIGIELTVVLSVSITAITSIEALFGWGKKSTQEHEYYCDVEMLRIEFEMYLNSGTVKDEQINEYLKRYNSIRSNFHRNRIDTVWESFQV